MKIKKITRVVVYLDRGELAKIMCQKLMTAQRLAEITQTTPHFIENVCTGVYAIDESFARKLCEALGVDQQSLFGDAYAENTPVTA